MKEAVRRGNIMQFAPELITGLNEMITGLHEMIID